MEMRVVRGNSFVDIPLARGDREGEEFENAPFGSRSYDLSRIVKLVRKRIVLVAAITILGAGLATVLAIYVLPNYTAKALLILDDAGSSASGAPDDSAIDTQIAEITSDANLNRVFVALSKDPVLHAAVPHPQELQRRLKVMQELRSKMIAVTFTARSPQVAADVANLSVLQYIHDLYAQNAGLESDAAARLAERRRQLEQELQLAQKDASKPQDAISAASSLLSGDNRVKDLQRQLDATQIYARLLQDRQDQARQQAMLSPPVRLYSLAMAPDQPSSTRPVLIIIPAFFVSLVWGIALAILLGRVSQKIGDEEQLTEALDAPCAGSVPRARKLRRSGPFDYILNEPRSPYAEAIRSIVVKTMLAESANPTIFLVASSQSGEGKSTFASSYAAYAAQAGRRVLLVDLDFTRKTALHGGRRTAPGLFDVLNDETTLKDAIRAVGRGRLDYLSLGRCPEDPLPLIASEAMAMLMRQLRSSYNYVIINGPPVLDLSETQLLVGLVDRTLLVVRRNRTKRANAREALSILASAGTAFGRSAGPFPVSTIFAFAADNAQPRRNAPAPRPRDRSRSMTPRPAAGQAADAPAALRLLDDRREPSAKTGTTI